MKIDFGEVYCCFAHHFFVLFSELNRSRNNLVLLVTITCFAHIIAGKILNVSGLNQMK